MDQRETVRGFPRPARMRLAALLGIVALSGCHAIPLTGKVDTDAHVGGKVETDARLTGKVDTDARVTANFRGAVDAGLKGSVEVRLPQASDPGPVVPIVIRQATGGPNAPRVAVLDVDGLLVNHNLTGLFSVGENPVAAFREKLEAAAADPRVRAVVVRVNSPGGGVAASDLMAEELRRFRARSGKPAVASLLDLATGGALYLAVGCDRIVALPTTVTGAIGAVVNHANLEDAMASFNIKMDAIKSGPLVDMGTVTTPLPDDVRKLFQEMADGFGARFLTRVTTAHPAMTQADRKLVADGRILSGPKAMAAHLVDVLGYPDDAIAEAERLAGAPGAEVVIFQRGLPDPIHLRHNPQRPHAIRPDPDQYARSGARQAADLPLSVAA